MTGSDYRFPAAWSGLDVSLCHDWLTGMRGGERVLEVLCQGFPRAEIRTLIHHRAAISETINRHPITTSWMQHLPGINRYYRRLLPLFPLAIETLPRARGDWLISTSHCVAKGLRTAPGTRHLCYCFTPMRYAWTFFKEYFGGRPAAALVARPLLAALRAWDRRTAARVDHFVAISHHVRRRIETFYQREADVVYPPVDTQRYRPDGRPPGSFDLIVSALVPYKRIDLAVAAYTRAGMPLKIVGVGGERARLQAMAGPTVEFLGWQADDRVGDLYCGCRLLVFPGEEDFGIVPLEAQSCGRPVVAYARGGALETVVDGVSGVFFREQTEASLLSAVHACAAATWNPAAIRAHAERFGVQSFIDGMAAAMERGRSAAPVRAVRSGG